MNGKKVIQMLPIMQLLTLGPIGNLPKAPGTMASLATLIAAWFLGYVGKEILVLATLLSLALGLWGIYYAYKSATLIEHDPKYVVIDEAFGMLLVLAYTPHSAMTYALAFVLFRVFDIYKPFPINFIDSRLKGNPRDNAIGIMFDDGMAAVYAIVGVKVLSVFF